MTPAQFFEKFDLLSELPNAVGKMRELILDLAATGQLVTPGGTKEDRRSSEYRLKELCLLITDGEHATPQRTSEGIPLVTAKNVRDGHLDLATTDWVALSTAEKCWRRCRPSHDDILMVCVGATTGRLCVANKPPDMVLVRSVALLRPNNELINPYFLSLFLRSPSGQGQIWSNVKQSAQPCLYLGRMGDFVVRVPSLAEQKRIVAKVDELMALCDRLEAQQKQREAQQAALVQASLTRFTDAPTPTNLEFLFHKSYAVDPDELRRIIIALAVQGKLLPRSQDHSEPLDLSLFTSRKYPSPSEDEVPFEIPTDWIWTRLGAIAVASDSGWSPQCESEARRGMQWGVLKVSAVSWGVFRPEENKALPTGMDARPDCEVRKGDFLLSRANTEDLVARSVVVGDTPPHLMMSDKIVRFKFAAQIDPSYVNLANMCESARIYYAKNASGTSSSMKNVSREVMCNLPIPLPPLAEQKRIVAKVEELMGVVDRLEAQLAASREVGAKLIEAVVAEIAAAA